MSCGQFVRCALSAFQHVHVCTHVWVKRPDAVSWLLFYCVYVEGYARVFVRACERIRVGTQVQSSSSVLILRVLTVSIESSWQLKEERKIGKWGGVSMLRPLPPHSSLAEDVWIYSGNATFERNKWEGSSFLLCVWIPSSGVSLSDAVQQREKEGESGIGSCSAPCFYLCVTVRSGCTVLVGEFLCSSTYRIIYFIMKFIGCVKDFFVIRHS